MNLSSRQRAILFAVIEEYSETATPVGSIMLSKLFQVSSATIRSEMGYLESLGLLEQPHTSAGRIPTDSGYRFYVNTLAENIESHGNAFAPHLLENKSLNRNTRVMEIRANSRENADQVIKSVVETLVDLTGNLGLATIGDQLYLRGISRLFSQPEFSDNSHVRSVAKLLDNLEPWLREVSPGEPLNIFIGQENPIGKNSGVALIVAKFRSPYSDKSYVGILGPTRQNYGKTMALVKYAGEILETVLIDNNEKGYL
ncbi:MAG: transcriptional regulator [Candidatus Saccharibacteria bacterium]|nr:transcriptional regulator [Candidatus Saccharibacteria bacterium]